MNDPTYDYVEEKFPTVEYTVLIGDKNGKAYHEAGPSTSNKTTGAHVYEVDVLYHQPNTSQVRSKDPVYEDPSVSQVCLQLVLRYTAITEVFKHNHPFSIQCHQQPFIYEVPENQTVFENAGIYVPTDVRQFNT